MAKPSIVFWPNSTRPSVASFRIRCAQVRACLAGHGIATALRDERARGFEGTPDVLILSKRTDPASLDVAIGLRRQGTRLVLDLCDNVYFGYRDAKAADRARFHALTARLDQCDAIVTPSTYLRNIVASHVREDMRFVVIPDAVEPAPVAGFLDRLRNFPAFRRLALLRDEIEGAGIPDGRHLIWFGISGTKKARNGLHDLAAFGDILDQHNFQRPLSLTVISDSRRKYEQTVAGRGFRSFYAPWNYWTFNSYFQFHDVAILPVRRNDYNWSKSANRLTTAFANNVAVAATAIPSYRPFRRAAVLDNWEDGLARLMDSPVSREKRIASGQRIIERDYSRAAVTRAWIDLLAGLEGAPPPVEPVVQKAGQGREASLKV